ncbi:MAG: TonB-dependent receptor [Saprospiraceae bacterium]|nr:TonB-dependent receptor [Saprospiraceae bacterium]
MKAKSFTLIYVFLPVFLKLHAQVLQGSVQDQNQKPLLGATVFFLNTGTGTQTDEKGEFFISRPPHQDSLVIAYTGYQTDTILIPKDMHQILLVLQEGIELEGVTIEAVRKSHSFSLLNPLNVETLHASEFRKAACCSLAESFQTSNTVDLSYNNAVVGNREIQFLGLRGAYTQQLIENRPVFTGILSTFGYDFIPGTWLERVNIQKGAGSSIYGAQSMTGAINVGLVSPETDPPVFVNAYGDYHGRYEGNIHLNKKWKDGLFSGLYLHGSRHSGFRDHNQDGFYDDARTLRLNGLWRNTFHSKNWEGQFNLHALRDFRSGGQTRMEDPYLSQQILSHFNVSGNVGYLGLPNKNMTIGSIWDFSKSNLDASFGKRNTLNANEHHFQSQIILTYESADKAHQLDAGPSLHLNIAEEKTKDIRFPIIQYNQMVAGLLLDYQWRYGQDCESEPAKLIVSSSQRLDWLNNQKALWLPRFNLRYNMTEQWTARASAGRGYRFFRVFSDQINLLSSNSSLSIGKLPDYELSWNYGLNLVGKPQVFGEEFEINIDAYRTDFEKQLVVGLDQFQNSQPLISIKELEGKSRAWVLGSTISYPFFDFIRAKFGFRYQNNKLNADFRFREQVMIPKWRGLVSLDWESKSKTWSVNMTMNYIGPMRLPDKPNYSHELIHDHTDKSPAYPLLQTQINYLKGRWDWYLGCENITNYTQHSAIIAASDPHGDFFNATEVFAPINGIKPYLGVRYKWQ